MARKRKQASGAAKRARAKARTAAAHVTAEPAVVPLRVGVVRWRSLVRDADGQHAGQAEHSALPRLNASWKGLMIHWLDGCPCDGCVAASAGLVVRVRGRAA